jgi:predicted nucleic acid-binding protein
LIAVDTNILVHAHREDSPFHAAAAERIAELAEGSATWTIPWPCLHEFLAIVAHPRIYMPASPRFRALDQVDVWIESPTLVLLAEAAEHWSTLRSGRPGFQPFRRPFRGQSTGCHLIDLISGHGYKPPR